MNDTGSPMALTTRVGTISSVNSDDGTYYVYELANPGAVAAGIWLELSHDLTALGINGSEIDEAKRSGELYLTVGHDFMGLPRPEKDPFDVGNLGDAYIDTSNGSSCETAGTAFISAQSSSEGLGGDGAIWDSTYDSSPERPLVGTKTEGFSDFSADGGFVWDYAPLMAHKAHQIPVGLSRRPTP